MDVIWMVKGREQEGRNEICGMSRTSKTKDMFIHIVRWSVLV